MERLKEKENLAVSITIEESQGHLKNEITLSTIEENQNDNLDVFYLDNTFWKTNIASFDLNFMDL